MTFEIDVVTVKAVERKMESESPISDNCLATEKWNAVYYALMNQICMIDAPNNCLVIIFVK